MESKELRNGEKMGKFGVRLFVCVGIMTLISALFVVEDIPPIEAFSAAGEIITENAGLCAGNGQEVNHMFTELLGGQLYWENTAGDKEQELILAENSALENESVPEGKALESAGDVDLSAAKAQETSAAVSSGVYHNNAALEKLKQTLDPHYLWNEFYIVDSTTSVTKNLFPVKELLERDMTMKKKEGKKQILIYHTHGASEYFKDSQAGKIEDSVVGVGDELTKELEKLGYGVIHDRKRYDWINGSLDRSLAYNESLDGIEKNLAENPDIQVVIDLHRDSVGKGKHTYTTLNGKKTAIVMFFNGMSRNKSGPIAYLENPNLTGNLAFSLQLKCKAMEYYDNFTKPIYLKGYRYNLHLKERSLLIELGNENNTVEEAKNAAAPLADILHKVLSGQ